MESASKSVDVFGCPTRIEFNEKQADEKREQRCKLVSVCEVAFPQTDAPDLDTFLAAIPEAEDVDKKEEGTQTESQSGKNLSRDAD